MKFSSLPRPLIALLFAYPAFALPTTRHDPFRAIALKEPKLGQEPICCLISPPPTEPQPTEDELLLSFEDWKAKLLSEGKSGSATGPSGDADASGTDPIQAVDGSENGNHEGGSVEGKDDRTDPSLLPHEIPTSGQPSSQDQADFVPGEPISPHFRVPLTDRFNYASMECSARIHKAHKSAKSAASILSSKKDRYMLSPCATKTADGKEENHFVIVELCEDIRIDIVQLANFEFFSGVFRDFTVSVAKTYTPDVPEWTTVGTYRARNIRGVQSFHLPTSLRDFYRYIRIDFHSHYGSEFYCPVSLLRVYGLTHLEEWKWDTQANRYEQLQVPASPQANPDPTSAIPVEAASETVSVAQTIHPTPEPTLEGERARAKTDIQPPSIPEPTSTPQCVQASGSPLPLVNTESIPTTDPLPPQSSSVISHSPSDVTQSTLISTPQTTEVASSVPVRSPPPVSPSQATPVISLGSQALISPHHAGTGGGENIYRTIMNRITMLELNATLHARYVEEQTVGVREVLKRLAEEIGRLEGIGKAQAQMYHRSLQQMQIHQKRLELEHGELMSRVQYLAEEITTEKRLGIAQLCIMVAVLVFMALTRGSRGEGVDHALLPRLSRRSRTTSLGDDWMRRLRTGSNPIVSTGSFDSSIARRKVPFDDEVTPALDRLERTPHRNQNAQSPPNSLKKTSGRARTPQNRTPRVVRVSNSTAPPFRPNIVRDNSQGQNWMSQSLSSSVIGPVPRSAKRWARTAHVHEIKRRDLDGGVSSQSEAEIETPDDSPKVEWSDTGKGKEVEGVAHSSFILDGNQPRRGSFGRSPLRSMSSTDMNVLETEVTDSWVDTDDASEPEADAYLSRTKERFTKSTETLTIRHSPGLVDVGAS